MAAPAVTPRIGSSPLRRVFGDRVFAVTYLAEAQSILGDQLARVALAVIVFRATGSTPATAATYAATFVPALVGGFGLARLGDRFDRRTVMVVCDVVRAVCFAVMTWRVHDLALVVALVVLTVAIGPLFTASHLSLLAARLDVEQFTAGNGARLITSQMMQVAGFAAGGVIATVFAPRDALLINAISFAVSAILLRLGLPASGPAGSSGAAYAPRSLDAAEPETATDLREDPGPWSRPLRHMSLATMCVGFFVVPEGLAVPFAASLQLRSSAAGVLLAAGALGGAIGATLLLRLSPQLRTGAAWAMARVCGMPLVLSSALAAWRMPWLLVAACWLASGAAAAYVIHMMSAIMHALPDSRRSALVGQITALLLASQGLGVVVFGVLGQWIGPNAAIGLAGGIGTVLVVLLNRSRCRVAAK